MRPFAKATLGIALSTVALLVTLAAPSSSESSLTGSGAAADERIAPRLGVALVGIAFAPDGRAPFGNTLPCPVRGVIHYVDSEAGRRTSFSGCDLDGGVVVDGGGELRWTGPGLKAEHESVFCYLTGPLPLDCPERLRWIGELAAKVDGTPAGPITEARIANLVVADRGLPYPEDLGFGMNAVGFVSMTVAVGGATARVDDRDLPAEIFAPTGLALDAIENPSKSIDALTEVDVDRLTWDAVAHLGRTLLNETLEVARGDHAHDLECGSMQVTVEEKKPILEFDRPTCEIRGLIWDGSFRLRWSNVDRTHYHLVLEGDVEVGGAIPHTRFREIAWNADVTGDSLRITGKLVGADRERSFNEVLEIAP